MLKVSPESSIMLVWKAGNELMVDSSLRLRMHQYISGLGARHFEYIPVEVLFPILLCIDNPLPAHTEFSMAAIVL
jgi:hypothetical protein